MTLFLYLLRLLCIGLAMALTGMFFIAIPGMTVQAVHKLGGGGTAALLEYLPIVAADLLPYLLPIALLLTLVATYGRLAADNEWTAMRMAGMAPWRSFVPAACLALICSAVLHVFVSQVSPHLSYQKRFLLKNAVADSFKNLSPGQTELELGRFYLNSHDRKGNVFYEALIFIPSRDGADDRTLLADTVELQAFEDTLVIDLTNCRTVHGSQDTQSGHTRVRLDLVQLFQVDRTVRDDGRFQSTPELVRYIAANELPPEQERKLTFEVHRRLSLACTPLLFLLLGVPTGLILRKGTQLAALAVAVIYALVYYVLSMRLGKTFGEGGSLPTWIAAWAPLIGGVGAGWYLSWKAYRE